MNAAAWLLWISSTTWYGQVLIGAKYAIQQHMMFYSVQTLINVQSWPFSVTVNCDEIVSSVNIIMVWLYRVLNLYSDGFRTSLHLFWQHHPASLQMQSYTESLHANSFTGWISFLKTLFQRRDTIRLGSNRSMCFE